MSPVMWNYHNRDAELQTGSLVFREDRLHLINDICGKLTLTTIQKHVSQ